MSVPRKGSRRIHVGDHAYTWFVRKKPTYAQGVAQSPMRVAIQSCDPGSTSVLIVSLLVTRPDNWIEPHQTGITPATIKDVIERALAAHFVTEEGRIGSHSYLAATRQKHHHENQAEDAGGRPTCGPVTGMSPTAATKRHHQKYNQNYREHC